MTPKKSDHLQLELMSGVLASYKRLGYEPAAALAELVDNSLQSFLDNDEALKKLADDDGPPLEVRITYDKPDTDGNGGSLRVFDNAMGMDLADLTEAMRIGKAPVNNGGLHEFGMGMKTAALWIGDTVTIRTSKLGEATQHDVVLSLKQLIEGNMDLDYNAIPADANDHYTIVDVTDLGTDRRWAGRAIGTIKTTLASTYRSPLRENLMLLEWQGTSLSVEDQGFAVRKDPDTGEEQKLEFEFETSTGRKVKGWAAILEKGSRSKAGFIVIRGQKVHYGCPDAWKPGGVFGTQACNLVNQRIFGEVNLSEFAISSVAGRILMTDDEDAEVNDNLLTLLAPLLNIAESARYARRGDGNQGPSDPELKRAAEDFKREIDEM